MGIELGISFLAHPYVDIKLFPVWRPPSWICNRYKDVAYFKIRSISSSGEWYLLGGWTVVDDPVEVSQ